MSMDEPISSRREMEELRQQVAAQAERHQRQLEELRSAMDRHVRPVVADEVRARLNSLLKSSALVVGLLGGLGIIGLLTKTIPDTVEAKVKTSVEVLTSTMGATVKERTEQVIEDVRSEAGKLRDDARDNTEAILKEAKESTAGLIEEVKKHAEEAKALRDQARSGAWIVLQTDYGDQDHYMGALKGAILCEDPSLRLDTITSNNPDYDVATAANVLFEASQHYPQGTVFLILVNPGAAQSDPIVLHTKNDLYFVGYDNGCMDVVARHFEVDSVRVISNAHKTCSRAETVGFSFTWLAPTAAWIARGADQSQAFADVGSAKSKYDFRLPEPRKAVVFENGAKGEVTQFDRFGNAWTNISTDLLRELGLQFKDQIRVKVNGQELTCPYVERYGEVEQGQPLAVPYNGFLQLAINRDNFRNFYKVKRASTIEISRVEQ